MTVDPASTTEPPAPPANGHYTLPAAMLEQLVADAKAKDKWERRGCSK